MYIIPVPQCATNIHIYMSVQGEQHGHVKELETDCRQKEARLITATEQLAAAEEKIQVRECCVLVCYCSAHRH